ncbi:MAG: hypothetical protein ACRC8S_14720 [Fimbriiglobus sp.]
MEKYFSIRMVILGVLGVAIPVGILLTAGIVSAENKSTYELIKDLFLPLISPLVAILIPVILLFIIPSNQNRQRLALDLCSQYFSEEMRDARNVGWRHFVTEQRQLPPVRRAERLNHFLDYLSNPEFHRIVDPGLDATYQKASRVLDFFAMVNGCVSRGVADSDMVRDFLLFYYLWWRDEIIEPMRKTQRVIADHPKVRPLWWEPLTHLDRLVDKK